MSSHNPQAWFLDFDGVLLDTAIIKAQLFVDLLPGLTPTQAEATMEFCLAEGGMPRREKFIHIHRHLLNAPLAAAQLETLVKKYTERVLSRVLKAPFLPGAMEAITSPNEGTLRFVISGTPHDEINAICKHLKIRRHFERIVGSPTSKPDWIERILNHYKLDPRQAVMIGDSLTDWQAAQDTGIAFLGIDVHDLEILPASETIFPDLRQLKSKIARLIQPVKQETTP
jgi:phosphoglycolate phosphatase